jgi:hypothetical protein
MEYEERTLVRPGSFHNSRQHPARSVGEIALRREFRPQFRESLHGAQQPAEIICLHGQDIQLKG